MIECVVYVCLGGVICCSTTREKHQKTSMKPTQNNTSSHFVAFQVSQSIRKVVFVAAACVSLHFTCVVLIDDGCEWPHEVCVSFHVSTPEGNDSTLTFSLSLNYKGSLWSVDQVVFNMTRTSYPSISNDAGSQRYMDTETSSVTYDRRTNSLLRVFHLFKILHLFSFLLSSMFVWKFPCLHLCHVTEFITMKTVICDRTKEVKRHLPVAVLRACSQKTIPTLILWQEECMCEALEGGSLGVSI